MLGAAIIYHDQTRARGTEEDDFIEISGPLCWYSFQNETKGVKNYLIKICNHRATFQIKADFVSSFNKEKFEAEFKDGDTLYFSVLKNNSKNFEEEDYVFVYEIRTNQSNYLSLQDTIEMDRSYLATFAGLGFVLTGLISATLGIVALKRKR
jgi:hypothetical protein